MKKKIALLVKCIKEPEWIVYYINRAGYGMFFSDKFFSKAMYKLFFKKRLSLTSPKTFNEKMQWLKLYDRNPIYTKMVDKYGSKQYVADAIGEKYVIPTIGVWDSADDIDFDSLPEQFVLKCTHDSGSILICKAKKEIDIKKTKAFFESRLKRNYYKLWREWPYKNVVPRIIAEPFLKDGDNEFLPVYKIMCFEGEPQIIQTIQNDKQPNESIDYFDVNWNLLDMKQNYPNSKVPFSKPACLQEMIQLARTLAEKTHFLRVDFYSVNDEVKFSEFTFYSDAGITKFTPFEWDNILGGMINIHGEEGNDARRM